MSIRLCWSNAADGSHLDQPYASFHDMWNMRFSDERTLIYEEVQQYKLVFANDVRRHTLGCHYYPLRTHVFDDLETAIVAAKLME